MPEVILVLDVILAPKLLWRVWDFQGGKSGRYSLGSVLVGLGVVWGTFEGGGV